MEQTKETKTKTEGKIKDYSKITKLMQQCITVKFCRDGAAHAVAFQMGAMQLAGEEWFGHAQDWMDGKVKLFRLSIFGNGRLLFTMLGAGNKEEERFERLPGSRREVRSNSRFYIEELGGLKDFAL